jgi:phosphate transport system substrate-binding protein
MTVECPDDILPERNGRIPMKAARRPSPVTQALVALVVLSVTLASPVAFAGASTLRIGGTGGALGTMKVLGEAFRKVEPGCTVTVLPSLSSDGGIKAVIEGAIELAVTARPLKPEEKAKGGVERVYGKSAIVFITHEGQNVPSLSQKQIADIYDGKFSRWPDGTPVRLIMRPENGSETKSLMALSPAMAQAIRAGLARKGMVYALTDQETADKVEKTPGAIAPSLLALILSEKRNVRVVALDGVPPTVKTISDGSYPMVRDAWTVIGPTPSPVAKRFVDFIHSPGGRKVLLQYGIVPVD